MQFFYQFPQRVDRLVLVSSGGLGREVTASLRSAALPGVSPLLAMTIRPRLVGALAQGGKLLRERGVGAGVYLQAAARALRPLQSAESRGAFLHTLRAVIDVHGQRVSATDRLYLLEALPTMIVWGERDNTIPLAHGLKAHEAIPHNRFETIPGAAHFPHLEEPDALAGLLRDFMRTTQPGAIEDGDWGAILARRSPPSPRIDNAAA
jgi:pimeloyl-ACP methyl ester carboxylesterase